MKKLLFLLLLTSPFKLVSAQADSSVQKNAVSVFERISKSMATFKPDTTAPPNDKFTQKIIALRNLRGGFNINEAIDFKLAEDRQKGELPSAQLQQLTQFFTTGNGKRWLDNAVIWIYRNHFTYKEVKTMLRFYKTSAGQKMADQFPIVMLQSLAAAEMLKGELLKEKPKGF